MKCFRSTIDRNRAIFYYRGRDKLVSGENEIDLIIEENGVLYFPILVSHEGESWQLFLDEGLERFVRGSYAGGYQEARRAAFNRNLGI